MLVFKSGTIQKKKSLEKILQKRFFFFFFQFSTLSHEVKDRVEVSLSALTQLEKDGTFSKHQSSRLMLELCLGFPLWTSHFRESAVPRAIISPNSHMNVLDAATRTDPSMDAVKN